MLDLIKGKRLLKELVRIRRDLFEILRSTWIRN